MNYRIFEKDIKNKINTAEVNLDIDKLIMDINKKQRKSRGGFIYFFSGIALLGLISILYFNQSKNSVTGTEYFLNQNNYTTSNFASTNATNEIATSNNGNDVPISTKALSNESQATKQIINNNLIAEVNIEKNNDLSSNKKERSSSQKHKTNNPNSTTPQTNNSTDEISNQTNNSFNNAAQNNIQNYTLTDLKSNNELAINVEENTKVKAILSDMKILSLLDPKLKNSPINLLSQLQSKDIQCPSFTHKNPFRISVIPEVGYFRPMKTLSLINSNEPSTILNLRKQNEKTLEGLQAALYVQLEHEKVPFYIRTGIHYAQITEKMTLNYTTIKTDTTQGVISITKSPNGDTITYIYGDIITQTTSTGLKIGHHKIALVDIPISIGYQKAFGGFDIGLELGALINVSMKASGKLLDSPNTMTNILSNNTPYKSNLGLSYFGSIFISKDILENQALYLALRGRYIPGQFTLPTASISEKYSMVGLHLGWKVSF